MTQEMEVLHRLPAPTLRALAASLREGPLSLNLAPPAIRRIVGSECAWAAGRIEELSRDGMSPRHIAAMLDGIAASVEDSPDPSVLFELVLSGPDVYSVPTEDTVAVFQTLVQEAEEEVLLVGYTVYDGKELFRPLVKRLQGTSGLKVVFCLDIARRPGDTSPDAEIVRRFAKEFRKRHWPWPELPELYYDPRALLHGEGRASLHAKCVVVDRKAALITSANFTEAAQQRNIELGLLVRHAPIAARIVEYFVGLRTSVLAPCLLSDGSA
jgi:phosphatidylserine/phosphatidylglycerophosphate/cardiolipin synthase-like enzyme